MRGRFLKNVFQYLRIDIDPVLCCHDGGWITESNDAIKAPINVFLTQFPIIDYGCAKNGAPISYFRTEGLSVEGMECLTDLKNLPNYAWHSSYHNFPDEVAKAQEKNPDLVRYVRLKFIVIVSLQPLCVGWPDT